MNDKNIIVIDDKGDVSKLMLDLFKNDSDIKIKFLKSNIENLKKNFTNLDYLLIINEDDLDCDMSEMINLLNDHFSKKMPIFILSSDEDSVKNHKLTFSDYNYLLKPIEKDKFKNTIKYIIKVCDYNRNCNNLSNVPGISIFKNKVQKELKKGTNFNFLYIDLNNFKEFNEYVGLKKADEVLVMFSQLLFNITKKYFNTNDVIGHVGGDDYVLLLTDTTKTEIICDKIIKEFDKKIVDYYSNEDLKKGFIEVLNRSGHLEKINIMGISIVIMKSSDLLNKTPDDIYIQMMKLKRIAKTKKCSTIMS